VGLFSGLPIWGVALAVFALRICDVSLGTLRTIAVVQGKMVLSVGLGFFEVLIWIAGVSSVMSNIGRYPILAVAYAAGFAAGNGAGILLERAIALGSVALTIISPGEGHTIADHLRAEGQRLTTFAGEGRDGPVTLIYPPCPRGGLRGVLDSARRVDPRLFNPVEPLRVWRLDAGRRPLPHATGWRAALKLK
jgi:uncharacterized protein YebE (UPF0316 family)